MRIAWVILLLAVTVNAEPDSTVTQPQKPAPRLVTKVLTGTIVGAVGCMLGTALPLSLVEADEPEEEVVWVAFDNRAVAALLGGSLGYVGGVAAGVKKADPDSSFPSVLLGSSLGYVAGVALILGQPALFPAAVFAPVFGAVAFSKGSSKPRLSVGVSPARVTARLRF